MTSPTILKTCRKPLFWLFGHSAFLGSSNIFRRSCQTVFSGIQPTGCPHLGNYFGAIKMWENLQKSYSCLFCVVDLHSITLPQNPTILRQNIHLMTASLLASGINPDTSVLFLQSQVPQHTELAWILGCLVTIPRLGQLPQYKEKSALVKDVPLGLFVYPVLQCADILLYKASKVPVGEDQLQHIQLTQHLARIFNNRFKNIFKIPEPLLDMQCARVKSLREPDKKMSKSDPDEKSRIELTDSSDVIVRRIKKAVTDFTSAVTFDIEQRPGVSNLLLMHSLCTGQSIEDICKHSQSMDTGQYKLVVADAVVEFLKPIRTRINNYLANPDYIEQVLKEGSEKAQKLAVETMHEVKETLGLTCKNTPLSRHMSLKSEERL